MFAVVGLDCRLPGSPDAASWLAASAPAFRTVPDGRWPTAPVVDKHPGAPDATSTDRGAFLDLAPSADGCDPLFELVEALAEGVIPAGADRGRAGLVVATLGLPSTGLVRQVAGPLLAAMAIDVPWLDGGNALDRHQAAGPTQRAAARLGIGGRAESLDAACASGLYAVGTATDRLAAGEIDLAIVVAVNRSDSSYLFHGFSQLRALSPSGASRPFDARADGLLVGEGGAAVALMRLPDARRSGAPIHAVIRSVGRGADGRKGNMLAPAEDGQLRTMRKAWQRAGVAPDTVGYVECHATGTPLGDGTELAALRALLARREGEPVRIGSAKALIGHTGTAAGLAGLLRAVGAVRDGHFPVTPCEQPRADLHGDGLLQVSTTAGPWRADGVRRAAVSAFGFGGTNAHLVLEADDATGAHPTGIVVPDPAAPPSWDVPDALAIVAVAARVGPLSDEALLDALQARRSLLAKPPDSVTSGLAASSGAFVEEVTVDPRRYRVPPVELLDLLPQQLLALEIASDAAARAPGLEPERTASVLGIEVDPQIALPVVRHALRGAGFEAEADAVAQALTASRVQGSLPNFVANRVAAQLGLQGPSYVVAGGSDSGTVALEHARHLLADPAIDAVVAGAVDVSGPREGAWGEGAVVFVVRRLADAQRRGDPIWAVLRPARIGAALGPTNPGDAPDPADLVGDCGAIDALVRLLMRLAQQTTGTVGRSPALAVEPRPRLPIEPDRWDRVVSVPHGGATFLRAERWDCAVLPRPQPRDATTAGVHRFSGGKLSDPEQLPWSTNALGSSVAAPALSTATTSTSAASAQTVPNAAEPAPARSARTAGASARTVPTAATARAAEAPVAGSGAVTRSPGADTDTERAALDDTGPLHTLAAALARSSAALVRAHGVFLDGQAAALEQLARVGDALERAARGTNPEATSRPRDGTPSDATVDHRGASQTADLGPGASSALRAASSATADLGPGASSALRAAPGATADLGPGASSALRAAPGATADLGRAASSALRSASQVPSVALPASVAERAVEPRDPRTPRTFDRAALLRHAGGSLSSVFGPAYADLDAFEPRVRMPLPPLLLADRVLAIEGERGQFGPSRVVTEYDVPQHPGWSADGRLPACVIVESGQADLFLVSFLGIDARCRGRRVYRLLDCDLEFVGPRPSPGDTLRHDIRIDRFAQLGETTLFYFGYDCVDQHGRAVLRMRNGCAGFFTPTELSAPKGVRLPDDAPALHAAIRPLLPGAPESLNAAALAALADRRFSEAFGPGFQPADGSALTLPPDPRWRLIHRVSRLATSGGPHGLGEVIGHQVLDDGDWFNACHFQGDPCMPGTLMLEGCTQAVQLWLLAMGIAAEFPVASFEAVPDRAIRLRCRGQVVPGHHGLTYHARIREFSMEPEPRVLADVVLSVDGVPVVVAHDVGVRVVGQRVPREASIPVVPRDRILEYSVGSAVRAFGPWYAPFEPPHGRCARMPGPPILQMTEVLSVEGPPQQIAAPRTVVIAYDVPPDAWYWRARPGGSMPFVVLLETALQPCGWLTAWQAAGITGGADLSFRNLGGVGAQLEEVWPNVGRLVTTARQTQVSASSGMQVQRFDVQVHAGDRLVFRCQTQFGYFTRPALKGQKGLPLTGSPWSTTVDRALDGHPALPRADLRMIDRLVVEDPTGGRAGLGRYAADKVVDPSDWYFVAHFWQDPVMPGSLGLEAMLQLAAVVHHERTGTRARLEPLTIGTDVTWTYRGQVLQHNRVVRIELEVLSIDPRHIRCRAVLRADGLPIYVFEDFGLRAAPDLAPVVLAARPRAPRAAPLLDRFDVQGDHGAGTLRLDPADHPWLDHHRPTMVAAAVPLAFAAEIAAEAARQLHPSLRVIGLPKLQAKHWIHTGDGPVDLQVVAVGAPTADADATWVAVTLAVGGRPHMEAVVALGARWPEAPHIPALDVPAAPWEGASFFEAGLTFHGPVLQGLKRLVGLGAAGATAVLETRADADLLGRPDLGSFVLDPLLIDAATHPMFSGEPHRWKPDLAEGRIAYPVAAEHLTLYGSRPSGEVTCRAALVRADDKHLVFDVALTGVDGLWATWRWTEALVAGGPVLGQPSAVRRAFLWNGVPMPQVRVGRATPDGWEVRASDLVEPIPGTLVALYGAPGRSALLQIAAREAVRERLRARTGVDTHPATLELARLRPGEWIVAEAATLTAEQYVAHLHPTRVRLVVTEAVGRAVARIFDRNEEPPTGVV